MKTSKMLIGAGVIAASLLAFAGAAQANPVVMTLDREFSGATNPTGPAPWGTATLVDIAPNTVRLTMSRANTMGAGEFIRSWFFNLSPTINLSGVTASHVSGLTAGGVGISTNAFRADGGPFMDIVFEFATSGANRFDADWTTSVYDFTGAGLTALSFVDPGLGAGNSPNGLFTAAHVQGINGEDSGWVTGGVVIVPLPPAAFAGLGGLALVAGVTAVRRRRHR